MVVMTAKQAAENGLYKYSTGKPCLKGHTALRYTNSGACVTCVADRVRRRTKFRSAALTAHRVGKRHVQYQVHPDDVATINEFVEALATARALS